MPINVCLFTSTAIIGGTERMALEFIGGCDRERVRPSLICLQGSEPLLDEVRKLDAAGLDLNWRGLIDFRARRSLCDFLREQQIELIHNFGLRAELVSRPFAKRCGVRRIVSGIRGIDPWRRFYHIWADQLTAGAVDLFIANSDAARLVALKREKMPPEKVITIHNGLRPLTRRAQVLRPQGEQPPHEAPLRSECLAKYGIDEDRSPIIVQVANLRPGKGYDLLLKAAAKLREEFPRLLVLCVGKDCMDGELQRQARALELHDTVLFPGYAANAHEALTLADVVTLPSRFESFPVSILEAFAHARPVVASDVGGISEAVRDGENGLLIAKDDVAALTDSLRRLLADPALRERMGRAARHTLEEHFTLTKMIDTLQETYERLLSP